MLTLCRVFLVLLSTAAACLTVVSNTYCRSSSETALGLDNITTFLQEGITNPQPDILFEQVTELFESRANVTADSEFSPCHKQFSWAIRVLTITIVVLASFYAYFSRENRWLRMVNLRSQLARLIYEYRTKTLVPNTKKRGKTQSVYVITPTDFQLVEEAKEDELFKHCFDLFKYVLMITKTVVTYAGTAGTA